MVDRLLVQLERSRVAAAWGKGDVSEVRFELVIVVWQLQTAIVLLLHLDKWILRFLEGSITLLIVILEVVCTGILLEGENLLLIARRRKRAYLGEA